MPKWEETAYCVQPKEKGLAHLPLCISPFHKHLFFLKLWEGMAYGCQLGHHWRVSYGGEGKSVVKRRFSMFGGQAATPLSGPPGQGETARASSGVR